MELVVGENVRAKILFVLVAFAFLFGCFEETVSKKKYDELENAYISVITDYKELRAQVGNLTEERNTLYSLSKNLSESCEESEAKIQGYVDSNRMASSKARGVERILDAHAFVLEKILGVENPEPQDVADATGMTSQLNSTQLDSKWQQYVSCGNCVDKKNRSIGFQLVLVDEAKKELSEALLEIKTE